MIASLGRARNENPAKINNPSPETPTKIRPGASVTSITAANAISAPRIPLPTTAAALGAQLVCCTASPYPFTAPNEVIHRCYPQWG